MAWITCLSEEIITIILGYDDISIEDIVNFRCTHKQFQRAAGFSKLIHKKFSQRWPNGKRYYDKKSNINEQLEFDGEIEEQSEGKREIQMIMNKSSNFTEIGINSVNLLRNIISEILDTQNSIINDSIDDIRNITVISKINKYIIKKIDRIAENFIINTSITDEIKYLLTTQSPWIAGCDLTNRYCNEKLYIYLRHRLWVEKLKRFFAKPVKNQLIERAATMLAQYIQPEKDIFYSRIKASLNTIAQNARNFLREKYPDHSIFRTSAENFSYWENNNIDENHWNEAEGTQIMDTLQEYIFGKLNFRFKHQKNIYIPWESDNLNCIDNVLENKYANHQMSLFIIYHSVARRLGLRCDIIEVNNRYLNIFWKPKYATNSLENVRCFNIINHNFPDCFREPNEVTIISAKTVLAKPATTTFQYTSNRIIKKISKIPPFQLIIFHRLASIRRSNTHPFFNIGRLSNRRPKKIKFVVGMIVKQNDERYEDQESTKRIFGVIIGWHENKYSIKEIRACDNQQRKVFYNFMPFYNYDDFGANKPHYIVLTEKNKICYINEDALTLTTGWVENSEIGYYFSTFKDTHYVPNKMMARLYPHDAAIINKKK